MSLDVMWCKVVDPKDANDTFKAQDYPRLQHFQSTGIICVKSYRIGRNCLDRRWYNRYDDAIDNNYVNDFVIVFPDEVDQRLLAFIKVTPGEEPYEWINRDEIKGCDFIYIAW